MIEIRNTPGQTPIDPQESSGLIPRLITQAELNEWEQDNIIAARQWMMRKPVLRRYDVFSERFILTLHKRMFGDVWKWAGKYRTTEKNLGVMPYDIHAAFYKLLGDTAYWQTHETYSTEDMAVIFHHRLVKIHLFSNGNGRHARMCADAFIMKAGGTPLSWGEKRKREDWRGDYIAALKAADGGDDAPILAFAKG